MNLVMRLTLDGLVRALKSKAHDLAEDAERRYPPGGDVALGDDVGRQPRRRPEKLGEHRDDRARR